MRSTTSIALLTAATVALVACGGDGDETRATTGSTPVAPTATPPAEPPTAATGSTTTAPPTAVPDSTVPPTTVPDSTTPPTTVNDEAWREQVDAFCAHWLPVVALPVPAADQASLEAYAQAHLDAWETAPDISTIELPPGPGRTAADLAALLAGQKHAIDDAVASATTGDFAATDEAIEVFLRHAGPVASAFAAAGQTCGPADAGVAANAALNVTMLTPWQVDIGYGSVWVSQDLVHRVVRIDADTGETVATIDMPSRPVKLQPADGRMVVRTDDSYVAIDAATNAVVDQLLKSDVGPNANRSWAVDGAMWICDGPRVHRYDPATFEPVAVVELNFECGQPRATSDLAVAFSYNEDPGDSGTAQAAFIDPATNSVLASVDLAGDPNVPVVLDDAVFFPPALGSHATVVDRSTWTVATSDLGRQVDGGSQPAYDGSDIYVIADKPTGTIVVIDPATFQITGQLSAIATAPSLNSLAATPGVVWAVNNSGGLLQRFDTAG